MLKNFFSENDGISSPLKTLTVCTQHVYRMKSPVCLAGSVCFSLISTDFLLSEKPELTL